MFFPVQLSHYICYDDKINILNILAHEIDGYCIITKSCGGEPALIMITVKNHSTAFIWDNFWLTPHGNFMKSENNNRVISKSIMYICEMFNINFWGSNVHKLCVQLFYKYAKKSMAELIKLNKSYSMVYKYMGISFILKEMGGSDVRFVILNNLMNLIMEIYKKNNDFVTFYEN